MKNSYYQYLVEAISTFSQIIETSSIALVFTFFRLFDTANCSDKTSHLAWESKMQPVEFEGVPSTDCTIRAYRITNISQLIVYYRRVCF